VTFSRAPKRAYIQAAPNMNGSNPFMSDSCEAVADALKEMGYKVIPFTPEKLPPLDKLSPETPVKGSTGYVKYLYERLFPGVTYPNIDVPRELTRFARRRITHSTLGELRARDKTEPFRYNEKFVKPSATPKLFRAQCASSAVGPWMSHHPDDTPITIQDYRVFQDEMRYFVSPWAGVTPLNRDPLWVSNDKRLHPFANQIHQAWKHVAPKCYVMDVGASYNPKSYSQRTYPTLVEINSVLTAGNLEESIVNPGRLVATGWKSYARYAERGEF